MAWLVPQAATAASFSVCQACALRHLLSSSAFTIDTSSRSMDSASSAPGCHLCTVGQGWGTTPSLVQHLTRGIGESVGPLHLGHSLITSSGVPIVDFGEKHQKNLGFLGRNFNLLGHNPSGAEYIISVYW